MSRSILCFIRLCFYTLETLPPCPSKDGRDKGGAAGGRVEPKAWASPPPTSTSLANLVIAGLDADIRAACESAGVRYSSWVDDLAFSGGDPRSIISTVIDILRTSGFSVSHRKVCVMGKADRKVLTRIVINRNARATDEYVAAIRSGIHHLRAGDVGVDEIPTYVERLSGRIDYVARLSPKKGVAVRERLRDALLHRRKKNS